MGYSVKAKAQLVQFLVFSGLSVSPWRDNRQRCQELVEQGLAMCPSPALLIGYDAAAQIAKESFSTGMTVRQIATNKKLLDPESLNNALDPRRITEPQSDIVESDGG